MKKKIILTLFLLMLTVFIVGCGKTGIVGSWASEAYSGKYVYTFKSDGTGTYDAAGNMMEFKYTIEGDKIAILYSGNTEPYESTYTIDGNTLNIIDSFGKDTIYKRK